MYLEPEGKLTGDNTGRFCGVSGRLRPPDPGRNPGDRQRGGGHPGRGAAGTHAHHARKFPGALQQPKLRGLGQLHGGRLPAGLRHDPERLRLQHRAHLHADAGESSGVAAHHAARPARLRSSPPSLRPRPSACPHRGEVPGVGRIVDGECAAGDSCGGAQQAHAGRAADAQRAA